MDFRNAGRAQSTYLSIAALFVESAALYSVFAIAFLFTYAFDAPINQVWLGFAQAAQISTYLIIYCVAIGKAWTRGTLYSVKKPTSVVFAHPRRDMNVLELSPESAPEAPVYVATANCGRGAAECDIEAT